MFKSRKKAKESVDALDAGASPVKQGTIFRRKKQQQIVEPEIDLSTALPSTDDFRTSLLMPNLSARFSMLREQDDPNSKLGKANDDSVLFPKRASRLNLFAHNPLSDIDETSSLKGTIQPPFLSERSNSVSSEAGYGSDSESISAVSIMSRSKPGQGNNLFGGRQKLYAIPAGSQSTKTVVSVGLGGKQLYENDIKPSAFQKLKQEEREKEKEKGRGLASGNEEEDRQPQGSNEEQETGGSPSTAFSKNRGTTSSTNSAPSNKRTSTAATSIDSQPSASSQLPKSNSQTQLDLSRQATIHRRLYGQALEQHPSARDIVEDISRQRAGSADRMAHPLLQSKSATNIYDKFRRTAPNYSSTFFRTTSPPPSATSPAQVPMDLGIRQNGASANASEHAFGGVPPLSPPISDSDGAATFAMSLQPTDRGKATAMGLFNKPNKQYDEQQFSQRQMQMHSSSTRTPPPNKTSPPIGALSSVPTNPISRASSTASSAGSRPSSINTSTPKESSKLVPSKQEPARPPVSSSPPEQKQPQGTFLDPASPSEDSDADPFLPIDRPSGQQMPIENIHPAFRQANPNTSSPVLEPADDTPFTYGSFSHSSPVPDDRGDMPVGGRAGDSPTLGPIGGIGGLIRTHLRHDSDRSILPPSPMLPPQDEYQPTMSTGIRSRTQPESMHSNPFEYDLASRHDIREELEQPLEPVHEPTAAMVMSEKARQILGQATALHDQNISKQQLLLQARPSQPFDHVSQQQPMRTWQEEMELRHNRSESPDTQQDQEDFSNEIAERRRRIRENLRSVADFNSRSESLTLTAEEVRQPKVGGAFSVLRSRTSKQNMNSRPAEKSSKAMEVLGLGVATMSSGSSTSPRAELWRDEEEKMLQDFAKRPGPRTARGPLLPQTAYSPPQPADTRRESPTSSHDISERQKGRTSSPSDERATGRPGRARSRSDRRYRDDLEQAMDEGRSSVVRDFFPSLQAAAAPPMPRRPSVDTVANAFDRAPSAGSGRYRSNSRVANPAASNYFDSKSPPPGQTGTPADIGLPRPSPLPLTAYSANSTPPLSMETSPTAPLVDLMPQATRSTPHLPIQAPRKKSITKGMISEPTFISSTNTVPTYGLPLGGPTSNPVEFPPASQHASDRDVSPPLPMMNPRRRRTTVTQQDSPVSSGRQTPIDHLTAPRSANALNIQLPPYNGHYPMTPGSAVLPHEQPDARSNFSDEEKQRPRPRQKLRKSSSEGGALNSRARAERLRAELSPVLPTQGIHQVMAMSGGPGGGYPVQGPGRSPGLPSNPQQQYNYPPGPGPVGAGPVPAPRMRSRTPTGGYPPLGQNPYRPLPPQMGGGAHTGKPMGWDDPSQTPPQASYGPPPHPHMQMGRPPARAGGPPAYGSGRTTPSGPPPGRPVMMRAPSRQRERMVDGVMF